MPQPIVELERVTKRYGKSEVVCGLDLSLLTGRCLGLLGPNGAGKTSTLKMMTGQASVTAGKVKLFGHAFRERPREIKARIGVVTQDDTLDEELSAFENLTVFASYFRIPAREAKQRAAELLEFVELSEKKAARITSLSGGMRRRLLIARALINAPELLILDEPTTGLDPQARHLIWQRLRTLKRQGVTLLLTTHYMEEAEQLCDDLILLDRGHVVARGSPEDLTAQYVGAEVIELRSSNLAPSTLQAKLHLDGLRCEATGDTLFIFLPEGHTVPEGLRGLPGVAFLHRRATLEDVFLRLTGRGLLE